MVMRVNKKTTAAKKPVQYATLSSGTISHVWCEEEIFFEKRQNKIQLVRDTVKKHSDLVRFEA